MRIVSLVDAGGDGDGKVTNLILDPAVDIEAERKKCRDWMLSEYHKQKADPEYRYPYIGFSEWLMTRCGAVRDTTIEVIDDDFHL